MRFDGRENNQLRSIQIIPDFTKTTGGSVLINWGGTRVLCTALLEEGTMPFLEGTGKGWLTAEYAMLPVWMLTTRWKDKSYKFAMNGQTGKLIGDLQVDAGKKMKYTMLIFLPLAVILAALVTFTLGW